jgi:hypothetical protein|tara:strand:+ start:1760 stop:2077 length:318 start_codon:yes stop_codon:yes gene_type:complete
MAWVKWIDGAVYNNAVYPNKGEGDDWRPINDETGDGVVGKNIVIVEEGGQLYRRAVDIDQTYKQKREAEYPHVKDQLDMLYKDQVNGTTTWKDAITVIKEKYPKE